MAPLRMPAHPLADAALRPARAVLGEPARAAAASAASARARCSRAAPAHSVLPLTQPLTAALGLLFAITAHVEDWPVAQGGSHAITRALASYLKSLGGRDRDGPAHRAARRAAARARRAVRHLARPARADRGRRAARGLPPPARALPLRARRVQARLGARRADPVARSRLPRGVDRARRRHARGDLRVGARHVPRPPLRAAVPDPVPAERVRPDARARGQAHRLRLLPRPARLDARHAPTRSRRRSSASRRASATASSRATR